MTLSRRVISWQSMMQTTGLMEKQHEEARLNSLHGQFCPQPNG
jgi:hypothetical protein